MNAIEINITRETDEEEETRTGRINKKGVCQLIGAVIIIIGCFVGLFLNNPSAVDLNDLFLTVIGAGVGFIMPSPSLRVK